MRVLVDITHPAFVHFFRAPIRALSGEGHAVHVTSRDKDVTLALLDAAGIEHECLSRCGRNPAALLAEMATRDLRLRRVVQRFRPDVLVAANGVFTAQVGWVTRTPSVSFDFDDDAVLQHRLYFPFATRIYTATSYRLRFGAAQRLYRGAWVLAYLHPRVFRRDPDIRAKVGLPVELPLVVCRLVRWTANHDYGHGGIPAQAMVPLLEELSRRAHVVVSSEGALPESLERYRFEVPPALLHQVLASADLYLGESATMAAEAAVLGVPSIYTGSRRPGYVEELEAGYGLVASARDVAACAAAATCALGEGAARAERTRRLERYLADSDDLVQVVVGAVTEAARGARAAARVEAAP